MESFGLKLGLDLETRGAQPHQKFQGVPPGQSTRSTGFLVFVFLFYCVTCHSNLRNSENNLVWKPLKGTRIVYSTSETRYFSKYESREHEIPLRSIYCLL